MYCTAMKNAVIAVGLTGGGAEAKEEVVNMDNDSAVQSEAKCEAFTALEYGTGECLLSYRDSGSSGGQTQRMGGGTWPLDTGANRYFTLDSTNW